MDRTLLVLIILFVISCVLAILFPKKIKETYIIEAGEKISVCYEGKCVEVKNCYNISKPDYFILICKK